MRRGNATNYPSSELRTGSTRPNPKASPAAAPPLPKVSTPAVVTSATDSKRRPTRARVGVGP